MPEISQRSIWRGATGLSVLALLLVVGNIVLAIGNQRRQAEVNQRQQFINQSIQLSRVNQMLINALAQAAAKNGDVEVRDLLAADGITFSISNAVPAGLPSKPKTKTK